MLTSFTNSCKYRREMSGFCAAGDEIEAMTAVVNSTVIWIYELYTAQHQYACQHELSPCI